VTTTDTMTTAHGQRAPRARRGIAGRDAGDVGRRLELHRGELTAFCVSRLPSRSEAEDAVQETLIRAWRSHDQFRGESSLRTWLYCIAANVCIDMLRSPQRRALPLDLGSARAADPAVGSSPPSAPWLAPFGAGTAQPVSGNAGDPAEAVASRDAVRRAFVILLQLPPRQRAALFLCEVMRWQANEVAELLDTTVASVTSALQRARATLVATAQAGQVPADGDHEIPDDLLARDVDAFDRCDLDSLVSLVR
jgi:RNA polymerase sigma-70 factor (ECF subfamily)